MTTIPTFNQLYTSILADLQAAYGDTISPVGKVMLRAFAIAQAGKFKLFYLALGGVQKNIFVDTADPVALGGTLERFGLVKLGRNPFPAQPALYNAFITATIGTVIPAGTTFKSDDDSLSPGMIFILDNAYTMPGATGTILIRALTPGTISGLSIGDTLSLTSPIATVNAGISVQTQQQQPLDAETIAAYRQAVINSYQLNPQGGSAVDYRLWASDAEGVAKVYPYASNGNINEIDLYIESVLADSTDSYGTPSVAMIANVKQVIENNPNIVPPMRRPLGVWQVNYLPINVLQIAIVINGYIYPTLTPAIKQAITNAISAALSLVRPFVAAADTLSSQNNIISINTLIGIIIAAQPGSTFNSVTFTVNGVSYQSYTFLLGNIPYFNPNTALTWT